MLSDIACQEKVETPSPCFSNVDSYAKLFCVHASEIFVNEHLTSLEIDSI